MDLKITPKKKRGGDFKPHPFTLSTKKMGKSQVRVSDDDIKAYFEKSQKEIR